MVYKTKIEEKAYKDAYRAANLDTLRRKAREYYANNKEARAEYRKVNSERLAAKSRRYTEDNRELLKERRKANKVVLAARALAYYEANKEKVKASKKAYYKDTVKERRAHNRLRKTGFDDPMFNLCKEMQNNKCAICLVDFEGMESTRVHADHCHTSNKPRGVLCRNCNHAIGLLKDSTENLTRAIEYLKNPPLDML